jgi:hypothetical protein
VEVELTYEKRRLNAELEVDLLPLTVLRALTMTPG